MNLLFDMDGTLLESGNAVEDGIRYTLSRFNIDISKSADLSEYVGPPLIEIFQSLLQNPNDQDVADALDIYRKRYRDKGFGLTAKYEGIEQVLDRAKYCNHKIYLATSKSLSLAHELLVHQGIIGYFDGVYGAEPSGLRSDKESLIAFIIKGRNMNRKDTVMLGDRKHDIHGAIHNNIKSIGVLWGYGSKDELVKAGADYLARSPHEILSFIKCVSFPKNDTV